MHNVRKNNAVDYTNVNGGNKKIAGMQCHISAMITKENEKIDKIKKRNIVLKYATECLKNSENISRVLIKSRIYAKKLKINVDSITEATMKMLIKKIEEQEEEHER